jgi:hypothetical protein
VQHPDHQSEAAEYISLVIPAQAGIQPEHNTQTINLKRPDISFLSFPPARE